MRNKGIQEGQGSSAMLVNGALSYVVFDDM